MKNLMGLGLAGLLGLLAAGLNWMWISGLATPDEFVAVASDIGIGEPLTEANLVSVPIPGNQATLQRSYVPWQNRAILFGINASRDYVAGDVVFHRDIKRPEEDSNWDVIGPFKLISVGERFKERAGDELEYARTDGNNLTIAVDANFDVRTKKLLDVIRPNQSSDGQQTSIVAVQVLPSNQSNGRLQRAEPEQIVYQTISLDGIANVPRVLLEGDMIRFVIPAHPTY
ncbi:MAG: hypothetical protein AAGA30_00310 [Planctomycetota bacterium]